MWDRRCELLATKLSRLLQLYNLQDWSGARAALDGVERMLVHDADGAQIYSDFFQKLSTDMAGRTSLTVRDDFVQFEKRITKGKIPPQFLRNMLQEWGSQHLRAPTLFSVFDLVAKLREVDSEFAANRRGKTQGQIKLMRAAVKKAFISAHLLLKNSVIYLATTDSVELENARTSSCLGFFALETSILDMKAVLQAL